MGKPCLGDGSGWGDLEGFLVEVSFELDRRMWSIQTEAGWRRSCSLIPVSTDRWLMALGVLILVLTWDPPTPGKAESPCLAGEGHRQRGRRERGVQEGEDQGEKAGHWSKAGRSAALAKARAPVPPPNGRAQIRSLALGPQFLPSTGRNMKELPE